MSQNQGNSIFERTEIKLIEVHILLQQFEDNIKESCKLEIIYQLETSYHRQGGGVLLLCETARQSVSKNAHKEIKHCIFLLLMRKGNHLIMSHFIRMKNIAWQGCTQ